MDIIDQSTIHSLASRDGFPCVSIYMPTHRSGREVQQDPIRMKNLLDRAQHELEGSGMRAPEAAEILSAATALLDSGSFWRHQELGLAVFVTPEGTDTFRLPVELEERVVIGDRLHLKPVWPSVSWGHRFAVLALSENEVRLLAGSRYRVSEIELPEDIPRSLAEALWFEDPEKQLQHHASSRAGGGRTVATFHGHGVPDQRDNERLKRFLHAVDDGVRHLLRPETPLVLAGAERPASFYRELSEHRQILDEHVPGNPERLSPSELHARAWELVEPFFDRDRRADIDRLMSAGAASAIETVVPAAFTGRVALVFAPASTEVWGLVGPDGVEVHDERMPGDRDLVDVAVVETWRHGGKVYVVPAEEVPGDGPLAALLRY